MTLPLHGALGRRKSDRNQLRLQPQLSAYFDYKAMPGPPLARPWNLVGGTVDGPPVSVSTFDNDKIGDCTCAAIAHHDQIAAAQLGMTSPITRDDVITMYRRSGYDPDDPSSDQGWNNLDAARAAKKAGWIDGFATFDPGNQWLMKIIVNEFGGAYCGIDLPNSAKAQMGTLWDVAPPNKRDSSYDRNSWGGHAATVVAFDHDGVTLATWGKFQLATWSFVYTYFDEGMALLNRCWASRPLTPSGIRLDALRADIARLYQVPHLFA